MAVVMDLHVDMGMLCARGMCTACTLHVHVHGTHTACKPHVHRSFWVLIALAVPVLALPLALLGPPSAQGAAERETTAFLQETLAVTLTNPEPNLQP